MKNTAIGLVAMLAAATASAQSETHALAAALSKPDAARVLPALAAIDRSGAAALAALAEPYPAGAQGTEELVRRITAIRAKALAQRGPGAFGRDFSVAPLMLAGGQAKPSQIELELDFAPARALLELLAAREQDPQRIMARLQRPDVKTVFEALVKHRSQNFYGVPMSLELLSQNIAMASSDTPLHQLYAHVNPSAFLDFAEVRRHLASYQALLNELEGKRAQIANATLAGFQQYAPADARFKRRISFLFCAGSDGWSEGDVAGIDLEFFKDNTGELLNMMLHETYHVAQEAAAPAPPEGTSPSAIWAEALDALYNEGSASFVAAPREIGAEELARQLARGHQLLAELEKAVFVDSSSDAARKLLDEGVAGSGPLYWVGRAMSRAIVDKGGPAALAAVLPGRAPAFLRAYRATLTQGSSAVPDSVLRRFP